MESSVKPIEQMRVDNLQLQVFETREEMGIQAAYDVARYMKELDQKQDHIRMIFASAPSQNEFLKALIQIPDLPWKKVEAFHMDEYIGLEAEAPQRFSHYIQTHLFDHVKPGKIHLIQPQATDPIQECNRYSQLLQEEKIDIVCLGIGENGHIAFNDPPVADFNDPEAVKLVELEQVCRQQQVNDKCFATIEEVPTHAITLTIPTIMGASKLFCIVPGATKKMAVRQTLEGPIHTQCPASILRQHPSCILYIDKDARK
ncbi:MAG: glucosamine-6-phosphate deaminase [Epulopiscium sp.]|nr:glucosamine-6-phosphate deaminase [Candidatus Epulonipiscium sp.]